MTLEELQALLTEERERNTALVSQLESANLAIANQKTLITQLQDYNKRLFNSREVNQVENEEEEEEEELNLESIIKNIRK